MSVADSIEQLRNRFFACKRFTPFEVLAKEANLDPVTLKKFAHGGGVTVATVYKIEAWCDAQERARERQ
jgi:hypothetical protein